MLDDMPLRDRLGLWGVDRDSPYRDMLLDFIDERARHLAARRTAPTTADEWHQRASSIRTRLGRSLGVDVQTVRDPPPATITGTLDRGEYRIEKLIYEARPGMPVSAHVYVPRQVQGRLPAVVYAPGHWMRYAKLEPDVQVLCANLARRGIITLAYDPIGQGERWGDHLDHGHLEPLLVGLSQEGLMVWESIRAIDYLVSRPDVDPQRIGMTGHSGGGLNTFYTAAVDERITVSVPVCFVNTLFLMMSSERDRNWEDGMDLCNQVPEVMAYAEMADICGLNAPKPLCIITATDDWLFPLVGARAAYQDTAQIYGLMDAAERVRLVEVAGPHGYDRGMREAAYGWLVRWLCEEGDGDPLPEMDDAPLALPPYERMGQTTRSTSDVAGVFSFPGGCAPRWSPAITALVARMADENTPRRSLPTDAAGWAAQRRTLLQHIHAVLGSWPADGRRWSGDRDSGRNRSYHRTQAEGIIAERVVFESEPGIVVPGLFVMPVEWDTPMPIIVYLDEWGKAAGLANGMIEALLAAHCAVLALDVRGIGETVASDFEATTAALMSDRPLFGQRVWDVLCAVERLRRGSYVTGYIDHQRIGCVGRGAAGLLALYAAALDPSIGATVAWQTPLSYTSLIVERPEFPPSTYLFDVLRHFDVPDLMAAIAPRPLLVEQPVDGLRSSLPPEAVAQFCAWPEQVYTLVGDANMFQRPHAQERRTLDTIARWLRASL